MKSYKNHPTVCSQTPMACGCWGLWYAWIAPVCSARYPISTFFRQKNLPLGSTPPPPPPLTKSWLLAWLYSMYMKYYLHIEGYKSEENKKKFKKHWPSRWFLIWLFFMARISKILFFFILFSKMRNFFFFFFVNWPFNNCRNNQLKAEIWWKYVLDYS